MYIDVITQDLISANKGVVNVNLKKMLDDRLETVGPSDVLLFSLLSKSSSRNQLIAGDHWTVLKLYINVGQWSFYSSMRPRTNYTKDAHQEKSIVLVRILMMFTQVSCSITIHWLHSIIIISLIPG